MEKPLTAPPPIGGWLILVAYKLLLILGLSFNGFFLNLPILAYPDVPNTIPAPVFLLCQGAIFALSVYAALLFFGRRREFRAVFVTLALLDAAFTAAYVFVAYQPMFESEAADFFLLAPEIASVVFSLACVAYLCFSRRVKNTFVFSRNAPDPDIRHTADGTGKMPLQIYGLTVVAGIQTVMVAHDTLIGCLQHFLLDYPENFIFPGILIYGVVAAASIAAILLFFARRKLFRPVFIGLVGVCILNNVYFAFNSYVQYQSSGLSEAAQVPVWGSLYVSLGVSAVFLAYYIALIVYILVSKRVKQTFINKTDIHITKDKLVSFGYRVLRVKEDDEADETGPDD